ncbi:hypothetical protein GYA49_01230 [Candidatus Beckwithbacteria bacterium]|nr:hypothetical protein [Candidatus Beckwithbacteria bacterium]
MQSDHLAQLHRKFRLQLALFVTLLIPAVILTNWMFTPSQVNKYTAQNAVNSGQTPQVLGQSTPALQIMNYDNTLGGGGLIALSSVDEPEIKINSYSYAGQVKVSLYQSDIDKLLHYLNYTVSDYQSKQVNPNIDPGDGELVKQFDYEIVKNAESSKILLPLEESGIWLVKISNGSEVVSGFIVRSKFGVLTKEGNNELLFWGQDFSSRRSISSGEVTIYNLQGEVRQIAEATISSEGIAQTPTGTDVDIAVVRSGGSLAVVPINLHNLNAYYSSSWKQFAPKSQVNTYFTFVDRPLYRPGDTIFFKSVIRDDDDASYTVPSGIATVKLYDDWGDDALIFEKQIGISAQGSIDGQFTLPENAKIGSYHLTISTAATNTSTAWFDVQYFRKPEYSLSVSTPKQELIAGDKSSFAISGSYFSGQPLAGEKVKYTIRTADYWEYSYYNEYAGQFSDDFRYGSWYGDNVDGGVVTLNADGVAEIELNAQTYGREKSQVISIRAEYTNASGDPAVAQHNILVRKGEFNIYRQRSDVAIALGKPLSIPIVLKPNKSGANLANITLNSTIKRNWWISYNVDGEKFPSYRKETENLDPITTKTNSNGEAELVMTPSKVGSYEFKVSGKDDRGNTVYKTFYAYVSEQDRFVSYGDNFNKISILADKENYLPSETAQLTISSSIPNRDVFLSLERDYVHRYQVVSLKGESGVVTLPLQDSDMPNIFASASSFSDEALDQNSTKLVVSTRSKQLLVTVTPDQDRYGPGDTVNLNLSTTDIGGSPVSTELTVWAVDKALFELVDENLGSIFDTFWHERYETTSSTHSLQGIYVSTAERGGGCFGAGTRVLMADGTEKPIEDIKTDDWILTRTSENDHNLVKAQVSGIHHVTETGYLLVNNHLKVTPNHKLFINGTWQEASYLQTGSKLLSNTGKEETVRSIEFIRDQIQVYNLSVDHYQTYFADGVWVHNQKGEARSVFKDTAYWNPTVQTDESGRASVSFKLPDNLTTWVVAAVGATQATQVGQNTQELIVSKEVIVRPALPNILRVGDKAMVYALVQNFTENEQKFMVDLEFDAGTVKNATYSGILLKANESKKLAWDLIPQQITPESKLTFSVWNPDNLKASDTVVQTLPIWRYGFLDTRGQVGQGNSNFTLSLDDDLDQSLSSVTVSLSPSLIGMLPTAMEYLLHYPYGCSEQTTSSIVPAIVAKTYPDIFASTLEKKRTMIDKTLEQGLKRLQDYQHNDGGWGWWHNDSSNYFISAYVVEHLLAAQKAGITVEPSMIENAKSYFASDSKPTDLTEQSAKFYGNSLLGNLPDVVTDFKNMTPDILALAVMAYENYNEPNAKATKALEQMAQTQGEEVFWQAGSKKYFASTDASTALAIKALIQANGDQDLIKKGLRYLARRRHNYYWSNTFATNQVIEAVMMAAQTSNELTPNYTYQINLDGKTLSSGQVSSPSQTIPDIELDLAAIKKGGSDLAIVQNGSGQLYSTIVYKEFHTDPKTQARSNSLTLTRSYENQKGSQYNLAVGDVVTVKLELSGLAGEEYYGVIEDQLPAGLIPINENFKNQERSQDSYYAGKEVTQNGMILSLYHVRSGTTTYTYQARAVSAGEFLTPPATASLMYAPEINARTSSEIITIAAESKVDLSKAALIKLKDWENFKMPVQLSKKMIAGILTFLGIVSIVGAYILKHKKHRARKAVFFEHEEKEEQKEEENSDNNI